MQMSRCDEFSTHICAPPTHWRTPFTLPREAATRITERNRESVHPPANPSADCAEFTRAGLWMSNEKFGNEKVRELRGLFSDQTSRVSLTLNTAPAPARPLLAHSIPHHRSRRC